MVGQLLGIRTAAIVQTVVTGLIVCAGLLLFAGAAFNGDIANAKPWIATPISGVLAVLMWSRKHLIWRAVSHLVIPV